MTTTDQPRVAAGVPHGGRYASTGHPEDAAVTLEADQAPVVSPASDRRAGTEDYSVDERVDQVFDLVAQYRNVNAWNDYHLSQGNLPDLQRPVWIASELRMATGVDIIEGNAQGFDYITEAVTQAGTAADPKDKDHLEKAARREVMHMLIRKDARGVAHRAAQQISSLDQDIARTHAEASALQQEHGLAAADPHAETRSAATTAGRTEAVRLHNLVREMHQEQGEQYRTLMKATTVDTPSPLRRAAFSAALEEVGPYQRAQTEYRRRNPGALYPTDQWAGDLRFACKKAEVVIEKQRAEARSAQGWSGLDVEDMVEDREGNSDWDPRTRPLR